MRPDGSPAAVAGAADTISHGASLTAAARGELTVAAARPAWTGQAASRFQDGVARMEGGFTTLIDASTSAAAALRAYAAELTRLQRKADALADQFAGYGIAIDPAGRAVPTPGLHDPVILDDNLRRHGPLFEDQARSLRHEADQAAADAIHRVDTARSLLHEHTSRSEYLRTQLLSAAGAVNTVYSAYTAPAGTASSAGQRLGELEDELRGLRAYAERKTSKVRASKAWAAYNDALRSSAAQRQALRETAAAGRSIAGRLPLSAELSATVGEAVNGRTLPAGLSRLGRVPVARGLPVVGTALTGVQITADIAGGGSPTKAVTSNLASLAAGSIAAEGAILLATGIGLTAGAPLVAGLAVGTAVAVGVGYAINAFFETKIGHDVAQAVDHAVGDAADAVGDAVSGAWRKVFG